MIRGIFRPVKRVRGGNGSRRILAVQLLEERQVLTALPLADAACGEVIGYEIRSSDGAPVSSLARVFVDEQGEATADIDLEARKIATSFEFFVDASMAVSGDGSTWQAAFQDLGEAILSVGQMSIASATFHVAQGLYSWGDISDPGISFNVIGAGIGSTVVEHRDGDRYAASLRGRDLYVEGVTFDGGSVDIRTGSRLTFVNSEFTRSAVGDGLNVVDVQTVVVYESIAHFNDADGFSYTNPGGAPMEVFEAFVVGSDNGLNGLWHSQGSSIHETAKIVRVGSSFERNPTNISDVSSYIGWNIDVTTRDALANDQGGQYLNYNVSGGGTGWIIAGSHYEGFNDPTVVNAVRTAEIRYVSLFGTLDATTHTVTGNNYLDDSPLSAITKQCRSFSLGDLRSGIAVHDHALGSGYVMFSAESIHSRFAAAPPHPNNSDHLIAVRVVNGIWQYNDNLNWHAFVPKPDDRLLASVNFEDDTIVSLQGSEGTVDGIEQGFESGDLSFATNLWRGAYDEGELSVTGTSFSVTSAQGAYGSSDILFPLGRLNSGIAVNDNATGSGYLLFSAMAVQTRFAANPPMTNNSEHLIAVRVANGRWQYNDNSLWHDFTPAPDDRLLAEIDFSSDTIMSLQGSETTISGIPQGFVSGDLTFFANLWGGTSDLGEFSVTGTFFTAAPSDGETGSDNGGSGETTFIIERLNAGIAVYDNATGDGYMMFSEESIHTRFADHPPHPNNSDHLVAVRLVNGVWQYNDNLVWHTFTPTANDRLLASIDFDEDTIVPLQGDQAVVNGIQQGYVSADLQFYANQWRGSYDFGEFYVTGTYFTATAATEDEDNGETTFSIGNLNAGVAADDKATGTGYMLFSVEQVQTRFSANPPQASNSEHLIAVRLVDGIWQYNDNLLWHDFTPATDDRLLASIDFDADTIVSLQGSDGQVNGIQQGYASGDLAFYANLWRGEFDAGEFSVTGTFFTVAPSAPDDGTVDDGSGEITFIVGPLNGGVAVDDKATGTGYILFSDQSIHTRFSANPPHSNNSNHLIAVRVVNGIWQYNDNLLWHAFTPVTGDRLLAAIDFGADTIVSLQGTDAKLNGIPQGYVDGDLSFAANLWRGALDPGEFEVTGTYFTAVAATVDAGAGEDNSGETTFIVGGLNSGVAMYDGATGTGYMLFSTESIHTRFSANPPHPNNSDHLAAVRLVDGDWQYNDNLNWHSFAPLPGDRLLAAIDYDQDTIVSLQGSEGIVNSIEQGYVSGDLTFAANLWRGEFDLGEFSVSGTYFTTLASSDSEVTGSSSPATASLSSEPTLAPDSFHPTDVNRDGSTNALDALAVLNRISASRSVGGDLAPTQQDRVYDVTGDQNITPLDALQVLTYVSQQRQGAAAAESAPRDELPRPRVDLEATDQMPARSDRRPPLDSSELTDQSTEQNDLPPLLTLTAADEVTDQAILELMH